MPSAAANSLGNALRQERLRKNLDVADITQETKISSHILEAIEEDRFDSIPGGAYRRHFIRQYACALGMDGEAAVAEYKNREEPVLPLPVPRKRKHSRVWAELAWAMVAVASVPSAYQFLHTKDTGLKPGKGATPKLEASHQSGQAARVSATPAPDPQSDPTAPAPPVHVAFTPTEPVWVSVKCDGNTSYSGVLAAPQSRTFDAAGKVTALVGNAGGLLISLNGQPIGPLGAHGEVQTIELTPNGARRIARQASSPNDPNSAPQF